MDDGTPDGRWKPPRYRRRNQYWATGLIGSLLLAFGFGQQAYAYSALTHEAIVDSVWDDSIRPLLLRKYAGASEAELRNAHAYAYGGCILQDLGYYPFGNRFFTELMHYVRSGDFVVALIEEAKPIEEYAFALGALEHYLADQTGHATATNVIVPIEFPKLRRKYNSWVSYEDAPDAHLRIEFGFDVLEVARGRYLSEQAHDLIGFQVAQPLLDRTFYKVYGLRLSDLLISEDLAIGTYRHTVSQLIPEATKIAWAMKQDELQQLLPGIQREHFVYDLPQEAYDKEWGDRYERPHWYDTLLGLVFRVVPSFGPLTALSIKVPSAESERLFRASVATSVERYRDVLHQLLTHVPPFADLNLDTGQPIQAGTYALADRAYAELLQRLQDHYFADATPELRNALLAFYGDLRAPIVTKSDRRVWHTVVAALAELRAVRAASPPVSKEETVGANERRLQRW